MTDYDSIFEFVRSKAVDLLVNSVGFEMLYAFAKIVRMDLLISVTRVNGAVLWTVDCAV